MSYRIVVALGFVTLLLASTARAELTAFWRHNPITPEAIADDPTLAGMQSWSLMVNIATGMWSSAGLRADLSLGQHYYRHPNGSLTRPSLAQQAAMPAIAFHSYVSQPIQGLDGSSPPSILGGFPDTSSPASFGGAGDTIPGTFSVAWGDPTGSAHPPGTFEVCRLTFPNDIFPTVNAESFVAQLNPPQVAPIPTTIPEPFRLSFVAAGILGMMRRRIN